MRYNKDGTVALMSKKKETRTFNGKAYVLEESIQGDYAFVKVHKADRLGNCQFRKAMNNFNEAMGKNSRVTIVEADHIVEVGEIAPEDIHLPGIYVKKVVQCTEERKIEKLTFSKDPQQMADEGKYFASIYIRCPGWQRGLLTCFIVAQGDDKRMRIIKRAAKEFKDGMYVNLGIGMPLAAPACLPPGIEVILQSENGILGMGGYPKPGEEDPDLINAGKETVTLTSGASLFGSHESFGLIRAGRLDLTILGALQVGMYGGE
jgi:3-oxoacid CoA-transferase